MSEQKITLAHGSGGQLTHDLIKHLFVRHFANPHLSRLTDAAVLSLPDTRIALTTDSYVIRPLFFPGGNIGKLAVCGTVNDVAVMGAKPLYLTCGLIIEEQFDYETLEQIVASMAHTAREAGVEIVIGDTKVIERGSGDGLFINTAGIGVCYYQFPPTIEIGDKIMINGTLGDHEIAVLSARQNLGFDVDVASDCASLAGLIGHVLKAYSSVKFMRDPTRGGLATVLNEIVEGQPFGIALDETDIPMKDAVRGICALLGFDPLYLANEGKVVLVVSAADAPRLLETMRAHPLGRDSRIIGEVVEAPQGLVYLRTNIGGKRVVDMPVGTQLPRSGDLTGFENL
ncbi:hydrogenase expression/formation protein HypE [Candidatus Moduliflexus flocculans]|uniref:Hydrogenase expression/formation protein HypE n=1 Tax=Candidatus Moduliflexus flocculans TaxID=1499966 RepID=A0A081BRG6_9BACT|nr:hydrogenase expression/formation protein HypE [Candidatus Moduliflexus flocculans]